MLNYRQSFGSVAVFFFFVYLIYHLKSKSNSVTRAMIHFLYSKLLRWQRVINDWFYSEAMGPQISFRSALKKWNSTSMKRHTKHIRDYFEKKPIIWDAFVEFDVIFDNKNCDNDFCKMTNPWKKFTIFIISSFSRLIKFINFEDFGDVQIFSRKSTSSISFKL